MRNDMNIIPLTISPNSSMNLQITVNTYIPEEIPYWLWYCIQPNDIDMSVNEFSKKHVTFGMGIDGTVVRCKQVVDLSTNWTEIEEQRFDIPTHAEEEWIDRIDNGANGCRATELNYIRNRIAEKCCFIKRHSMRMGMINHNLDATKLKALLEFVRQIPVVMRIFSNYKTESGVY